MSQIIVIGSSDEETNTVSLEKMEQNIEGESSDIADEMKLKNCNTGTTLMEDGNLFQKFTECCSLLVKNSSNGQKIVKFLQKKYNESSEEYKSCRSFRKLLQRCISKLENGSQDVFVHVHDVVSMLDQANGSNEKRPMYSGCSEIKADIFSSTACKKRRITTHFVESKLVLNDNPDAQVTEYNEEDCDELACKDIVGASSDNNESIKRKHIKKIEHLEMLLKKISNEIVRLQSTELSLEDLDRKDTSYIQESKLKKRFMQIYQQLCKINKSSILTGRVNERKIKVRASRFSEINTKIECFINNPKRNDNFPDFVDIYHLVKQASEKNMLDLNEAQMQSIAKCVFTEVGESMQKRRHQDFIFEFGCSIIDNEKELPDPACADDILTTKLMENRSLAKSNLDSVIEKYSKIQNEMSEVELEGMNDESDSEEKKGEFQL